MSLFKILTDLETSNDLHIARLLILLDAFAGKDGAGAIDGLTKLAKLDFLLRYPTYLERALQARNRSTAKVLLKEHEEKSVESQMVRYRYGPWDFRYRKFINLMAAKGLLQYKPEGRTIRLSITESGRSQVEKIRNDDSFDDMTRRSKILKTHFDLSGTNLMRFIYRTFPEIASLRFGEDIGL